MSYTSGGIFLDKPGSLALGIEEGGVSSLHYVARSLASANLFLVRLVGHVVVAPKKVTELLENKEPELERMLVPKECPILQ